LKGTRLDPTYRLTTLSGLSTRRWRRTFSGYSVRALQNWRLRGGGPRFVKVSARSVRYRRRDLIAWAEQRIRESTSAER
jgi:predicted DNA-binding transcriptional regulator AlpA